MPAFMGNILQWDYEPGTVAQKILEACDRRRTQRCAADRQNAIEAVLLGTKGIADDGQVFRKLRVHERNERAELAPPSASEMITMEARRLSW